MKTIDHNGIHREHISLMFSIEYAFIILRSIYLKLSYQPEPTTDGGSKIDSEEIISRRTAMAGPHTSVHIWKGSIILSFILVNILASLYAVKGGTGLLFYFLNQSCEKGINKHKVQKSSIKSPKVHRRCCKFSSGW